MLKQKKGLDLDYIFFGRKFDSVRSLTMVNKADEKIFGKYKPCKQFKNISSFEKTLTLNAFRHLQKRPKPQLLIGPVPTNGV